MDVRELILKELEKKKQLRVADIVKKTGFSRAYVSRFFKQLKDEGKIVLFGKANKAFYVKSGEESIMKAKQSIKEFRKEFVNKKFGNEGFSEDKVFNEIKQNTGILVGLSKNVYQIVQYAFTEILNNAIDHSNSYSIGIYVERRRNEIYFRIRDIGVGIFKNIMKKKSLKNDFEAIEDLLKGKQTTAPEKHSGEGIFFTSKAVDFMAISSYRRMLVFYPYDYWVEDAPKFVGTSVTCVVKLDSQISLDQVFNKYTDSSFEFSKTEVKIKLYQMGTEYISRSQAKRVLNGLDKFKKIILDFKGVSTVGQGFADEVFRVWQNSHPEIEIEAVNANENVLFMIKRVV